ncbi:MAG: DUF6285 domain-containing protein [Anaerolineae bacterium]|nr:DUF6285 domain-containing protein [Anaerolineae bacterium]MDW8173545.1 DUF6285 domain-containing protein [Anaerolineae bacterium]
MNDRPSAPELIDAVRQHLEGQVLPLAKRESHKLYFQTLVAVNVLRIVAREWALGAGHWLAEWQRLDAILGQEALPARDEALREALVARNATLCAAIRAGQHDDASAALFNHLKACAIEQLTVANPKFLAALAQEDAQLSQSAKN